MRISLLFLCLLFSFKIFGQGGYFYLKHFEVPLPDQQYIFNDLSTDQQNRLLIAHRSGILQFDGKLWDKIDTESSPHRFIKIGDTTFVLTKNSLNILKQDAFSQNTLEKVFENPSSLAAVDLIKQGGSYYYLVDKKIIRFKSNNFEIDTVFESRLGYEDVFSLNNRLYAFEQNYLLELVNDTWLDLNMYASENSDFVFSCQTEKRVFFAYDNGDFFIFNGNSLEKYSTSLNEYLRENYPVSGKVINDKLLIATLDGGAVVVNIKDGGIDYTIRFQNGLPADEVKAITIDKQGGIWLAHQSGLSRALPNLPLKEFQHYPGLSGIPNSIYKYKDSLVVGTNEGLFFLETIKDYEQLQKVLQKRVRVNNPAYQREKEAENDSFLDQLFNFSDQEDNEQEVFLAQRLEYYKAVYKDQGYRFRSLREKLNEKENYLKDSIKKAMVKSDDYQPSKFNYKTVSKLVNVSKLKSIKYQYSKMEGIDSKVNQLIDTPYGFYALASDGLYQIVSNRARKVWTKLFLDGMLYDQERNLMWLYGAEGLFSVDLRSKGDQNLSSKEHLEDPITELCLYKDHLIVGNFNLLQHFKIKGASLQGVGEVPFSNPYSQKVLIFTKNDSIQVIKADGLFNYNLSGDSLDLLKSYHQSLVSYYKDNEGKLWLSVDGQWQILNQEKKEVEMNRLKILPPVNQVYVDSEQYIYFISSNMILRLDTESEFQLKETNSFINGAYQASSKMFEGEVIQLTHDNNSLKVSLSTPEYLFPEGVRYQYFVKGLMDEWSAWSRASEIEFPFIPTGDYTLQVHAKTGFYGNKKEIKFNFQVLPPYWKTWWFYMLEIAFFSILILISQRLNLKNKDNKNSYLTNTITFLTLILFIEFIATVLENNLEGYVDDSPVYGFLLNVILAVSILPLEKGINKLFKSMQMAKNNHEKMVGNYKKQSKEK